MPEYFFNRHPEFISGSFVISTAGRDFSVALLLPNDKKMDHLKLYPEHKSSIPFSTKI